MPFPVRKRLACFYCGSWSAKQYRPKLRNWQCERCEATNWLDEHGSVADPPPQPTPQPASLVRFARSVSPPQTDRIAVGSATQSIFCATCIRNQHIVQQLLSDYLPPDTHPEYERYLASYDKYKKDIETRYEECCPACAVKAREQIQSSLKMAGSDHLLRLMNRTRSMAFRRSGGGLWKDLALMLARFAWWSSLLFSILWHALAAGVPERSDVSAGNEIMLRPLWSEYTVCMRGLYEERQLLPQCVPDLVPLVPLSLALGLSSIWWHPHLWMFYHRQNRPQFLGLPTYYIFQVVSLIIRASASKMPLPYESAPSYIKLDTLRGLHALVCISLVVITWVSRKSIRLQRSPAVNFHMNRSEILPHIPLPLSTQQMSVSTHPTPAANSFFQRQAPPTFDINCLVPPNAGQNSYRPPTPPPEENYCDADAMDWSPTIHTTTQPFQPNRRPEPIPARATGPSPFHGTLPPAPMAPSHKLRNPNAYNPAVFRAPTEFQKASAFAKFIDTNAGNGSLKRRAGNRRDQWDNESETTSIAATDGSENTNPYPASTNGVSGSRRVTRSSTKRTEMVMAQPGFWPPEDSRETGLEELIGGRSFGLTDSPLGKGDDTRKGGWSWWGRC